MLRKLKKQNMGTSNLGWLESQFHFSFANYIDYTNMQFGVLRVLNDDVIHSKSGFDTHSHKNMEIISYVIDGELTHKDSMGNEETLNRGNVQYLSAGDGIYHSEYNHHSSKDLRILQIWILPPKDGLPKLYGSHKYLKEEKENKLLNIVSSHTGDAKVKIYQDVNFFASELDDNKTLEYNIKEGRQVYFVQIEGSSIVNNIELNHGDAMEITKKKILNITGVSNSHFLFIEMKEQ